MVATMLRKRLACQEAWGHYADYPKSPQEKDQTVVIMSGKMVFLVFPRTGSQSASDRQTAWRHCRSHLYVFTGKGGYVAGV